MSGPLRRVAVYGEIDPNLVDGSSVWLQSVCQVLASIDGVEVSLLLRRPLQPERRFLLAELELSDRIELVDSGDPRLLAPGEALDLLEELDRERGPFDVVLLRGQTLLAEAAGRDAFDGRLWPYAMTGLGMPDATLRELAARSSRILCQTETAAEELRKIAPEAAGSLLVLPPMVPDGGPPPADSTLSPSQEGAGGDVLRLVYSGKLSPEYCWLETVASYRALRERVPAAELHVIGDKIHRPPHLPGFHEQATSSLGDTPGLRWHGAVPRAAVPGLLAGCDLALSIRDPGVEAARELSTKVLEYGAAHLPVILNRAPAYERLLGTGYPLFVDGPADAERALRGPGLDPAARRAAAAACHAASREFTFSRVAARLAPHLSAGSAAPGPAAVPAPPAPAPAPTSNGSGAQGGAPTRVLVAGHDLKFTGEVREAIAGAGAALAEDVWKSHSEHDEAASRAALERADVVVCEWCLGNAAWYSRNKRPDQRLVVRFHRMELETDHPRRVDFDAVDQVVFVARHVLEEAAERFGWDRARLRVVPNAVDCQRLRRPKLPRTRFTLAMIGYVPRLKRLDRALDVLEELRCREPRFRLLLTGHPPSELGWVVRRPEEVEFFRRCFERIQRSDALRGAVAFAPFTGDLPALLRRAGFLLSTSDVEGHQVGLAEGAASGAVPVLLDRPGARDQYPERCVHADAAAAADAVAALAEVGFEAAAAEAAEHAGAWDRSRILPTWREVIEGPAPALMQS